DCRMRAAAGLDAEDALGRQRARARKELGILFRIDVVGDDGDVVLVAHMLAQAIDERGLAGADRAADADAKRTMGRFHERKSLVYWVSCRIEHQSSNGAAVPISSSFASIAAVAAAATGSASAAMTRWPSV